jgi:outer membrane protein OmpA-like peptidoglycan-associated protein
MAASGLVVLGLGAGAAQAQPIQGLYIGAAGGANFLDTERTLSLKTTTGTALTKPGQSANYKTGWAALGSVGYAFGNGVRLEVEGSGRSNMRDFGSRSGAGVSGSETKTGAMANVLFDMDIGSRYIFPYIGAGAGYQSVGYDLGGSTTIHGSQDSFAYQAMLGAAFPIPGIVGLSATAEYRYLTTNGHRRYTGTSNVSGIATPVSVQTADNNNHEILIGLRYAFNVPPPPVAAAPAPAPVAAAPAPQPSRSYLVFFDWDKYDLDARARQIVAEAAEASRRVADTKIALAGHADSSGTAPYNQDLSRKRAATVAGELVRLGVPAASISVTSYGDTRPLVQTAPGTREPQNRRVEIVLK